MEILARLGLLFGLSFVSGVNLYATIAVVGLSIKHHLVTGLPPELSILANDGIIALAIFFYMIEFIMDKVPGLDTLWDALHTLIRPVGGALLALLLAGESTPVLQVLAFMTGAGLASMAHATKASTRLIINASPEPFSNILVSIGEDLGVIGLSYLALAHPLSSLCIVILCVAAIVALLPLLFRTIRMFVAGVLTRLGALFVASPGTTGAGGFWTPKGSHGLPGENILWSGMAYAVRVPHAPKFCRTEVVVTTEAVHLIFRQRLKHREVTLPRAMIRGSRLFPGRLFSRWVLRSDAEDWHMYLPLSLAKTLPMEALTKGSRDA